MIHQKPTMNVCNGLKRLGWYLINHDDELTYSTQIGKNELDMLAGSDASFCNGQHLESFYAFIVTLCGATLIGRTKIIPSIIRCTQDI